MDVSTPDETPTSDGEESEPPVTETEPENGAENPSSVTLSFDANGGTGEVPEPITVLSGESITLPTGETLFSDSLSFAGWTVQPNAGQPDYRGGESFAPVSDLILYAVYVPESFQVTYITGEESTVEEVTPGGIPAQIPDGASSWLDEEGNAVDLQTLEIWSDRTFVAVLRPKLNTTDHIKYMDGYSDGLFHPNDNLTKGQVAQILYNLLLEKPAATRTFSDVPETSAFYQAACAMAELDIMSADSNGNFYPNETMSRAYFAVILTNFISAPDGEISKTFPDVPESHWAYNAINTVVYWGYFSGDANGNFRPSDPLTRAAAAAVFNRVLNRQPDESTILSASNIRIFPDVTHYHWAYYHIMEATAAHTYTIDESGAEHWTAITDSKTVLSDGYQRINGWLYRVQNGQFLRSTSVDGFTYDVDGRYTTGIAELDQRLNAIVEERTNDSMTLDQKLYALYTFVRDGHSYLSRPHVTKGTVGWEVSYALEFLQKGKGNCFSFSATYRELTRELGLASISTIGVVGARRSPHSWVEINLNGTLYLFDTELDMAYRKKGNYSFNFFKMTYRTVPFYYAK